MTYLIPSRFARIVTLPIAMAQTELRRGKSIQIVAWTLSAGQRLVLRALTVHVIKILNPGLLPVYNNTALGMASVGLYLGTTLTSPLAWATTENVGAVTTNPFAVCAAVTPGTYTVIVSNNSNNLDLSVCVTGSLKLYA